MVQQERRALLGREQVLSRSCVESLIAEGKKIVIVDGMVLKVDAWLPFHPGGDKAILHMVGKDATDEVNAYVNRPQDKGERSLTMAKATFAGG